MLCCDIRCAAGSCGNCDCHCVCQAVERILHTSYVSVSFIKLVLSAVVDQLQAHCMYICTLLKFIFV